MRIITGIYKNRLIPTSKKADYRPSTSKFREALFSIISSGDFAEQQPIKDADVLDVFAGTGALSFEALSRGAKSITLVDTNKEHLAAATVFANKLGQPANIETICSDALRLGTSFKRYDLVFLDPPYYKNLIYKTIDHLIKNKWLKNGALVTVEMSKTENVKTHNNLELVKEKLYGKNKLLLFKYHENINLKNDEA